VNNPTIYQQFGVWIADSELFCKLRGKILGISYRMSVSQRLKNCLYSKHTVVTVHLTLGSNPTITT
jgi:hypothetical protein